MLSVLKLVSEIEAQTELDAVWAIFSKLNNELGFEYFVYTVASQDMDKFYYYDNFDLHPEDESRFYDPFLDYCCHSYETTFTGKEFLEDHKELKLTEKEVSLIERGAALGMRSGLGIPLRLKGSNRFGGFNLGSALTKSELKTHVLEVKETAQLACMLVHRHIEKLLDIASVLTDTKTDIYAIESLSKRENQVLSLIAQGHSRQKCAQKLNLSESTISTHIKNIYSKLGVHNRVEASRIAQQNNPILLRTNS